MTSNQIAYREYQERVRHDKATETQAAAELREANRANLAREAENYRTDTANEAIKQQTNVINNAHYLRQDAENHRGNVANEMLKLQQNLISARTVDVSAASQKEQARHNLAGEIIDLVKNATNKTLKNAEIQLGYDQQFIDVQQNALDRSLKKEDLWIKDQQLVINREANDINRSRVDAQNFRDYSSGVQSLSQSLFNIIKVVKPIPAKR